MSKETKGAETQGAKAPKAKETDYTLKRDFLSLKKGDKVELSESKAKIFKAKGII